MSSMERAYEVINVNPEFQLLIKQGVPEDRVLLACILAILDSDSCELEVENN